MIDSLTQTVGVPVSAIAVVINIALSLVLALAIAYVYRKTHRGLSYSQQFVITLIIMSLITAVVMMVIGNNLAVAFGLLGAFSIIRFRTAVKETKDTGYIFFALAEGLAVGTSSYTIAVISTILVSIVILVLHRLNFGLIRPRRYLLTFIINHKEASSIFEPLFKKYLKYSLLLNINARRNGEASEMTYDIDFVDAGKSNEFVKEFGVMSGVEKVNVIASTSDVEY